MHTGRCRLIRLPEKRSETKLLTLAFVRCAIRPEPPGCSTSDEVDCIRASWATTDADCELPRAFSIIFAQSFHSLPFQPQHDFWCIGLRNGRFYASEYIFIFLTGLNGWPLRLRFFPALSSASSSGCRAWRLCRWSSLALISRWHVHVQAITARTCVHACVGANSVSCRGAPGQHAGSAPRPVGFWTRDCTQTDSGCAAQRGEMPVMSGNEGIRDARALLLHSHAPPRPNAVCVVGRAALLKAEEHQWQR